MHATARVFAPLIALALFVCLVPGAYAASININTASAELLETLPGIGPSKAAAIIAYRGAHGPFKTIEDIQEVSGIGPATFAKLAALITVSVTAPAQPAPPSPRSQSVQVVESAVSNTPNVSTHQDQAVEAPTAMAEPAAVGAAQPPVLGDTGVGFLHSRWMVGLLVVLAFAGGAFMIL